MILVDGSPDATPGLTLWAADLADAADVEAIDGLKN
jgi:hypothetical protein